MPINEKKLRDAFDAASKSTAFNKSQRAVFVPMRDAITLTVPPPVDTPPTASVSVQPVGGTAPLTVTALLTAADDKPGLACTIAWGDGAVEPIAPGVAKQHTYSAAGSYFMKVDAVDSAGQATTTPRTSILVTSPPVVLRPDLIIESLGLESLDGGDSRAVLKVRNIGGAMPAPAIVDAAVNIETHPEFAVVWSDNVTIQLAAGEAVSLLTNGGEGVGADGRFHGLVPGTTYTLVALCNGGPTGTGRFDEESRTNNGAFATVTILGTPPVEPPPTPGPTGRRKVIGWGGVVDTNKIVQNPALLAKLKPALTGGWVYMMNAVADPTPDWQITQMRMMKAAVGRVFPGMYGARVMLDIEYARTQARALAVAARAAGASGSALDLEPYAPVNHFMWSDGSLTRTQAKAVGVAIGTEWADLGECIIYTSSDGAFTGSYNDKIAAENGTPNAYATNVAADFMDGLATGGLKFTYQDSSFHWGPQGRGDTWPTGTADSVARTMRRWPAQHGGIMFWPDNVERFGPGGHFSPEEMAYAVDWCTRNGTGDSTLYQQSLADGGSYWDAVLSQIGAALAVPA